MDLKQAIIKNDVPAAESIIKQELEKNSNDIQLWIKLCLIELQTPFVDYISALICIDTIYKISPDNLEALILETGIKWHSFGFIEDELFGRLKKVKCEDKRKMAIIYYLLSLYYSCNKDTENEKLTLEESLNLYDKFVYPTKALGHILLAESKIEESKKMFQKAFKNVQKVYKIDDFYDFTDPETYIAEFITGTAISDSNYEWLAELAQESV